MGLKTIVSDMNDRLVQALTGSIGFLSEQLYDLQISQSHTRFAVSKYNARKLLIIVARSHYFETVRDYPVGSLRDLHKIIKTESWRYPFPGRLFYRIERRSHQSHRVTSWVIKQSVVDNLEYEPIWIVPESACLGTYAGSSTKIFKRLGENVFVGNTPDGIFSGISNAGNLLEKIGMSAELAGLSSSETLEEPATIDRILLGAESTIKSHPIVFLNRGIIPSISTISWKKILGISFSLVSFYLVLTSSYVIAGKVMIERELNTLEGRANSLLSLKQNIVKKQSFLSEMDEMMPSSNPHWDGWNIYLDLKKMGVQFTAVTTSKSLMNIVCVADKATDILGFLVSDPRVKSAQFSSAIRQDSLGEMFSIEIQFRDVDSFLRSVARPEGGAMAAKSVNQVLNGSARSDAEVGEK